MSQDFTELRAIMLALCEQYERFWLEREAAKIILASSGVTRWEETFAALLDDADLKSRAQDACKSMRSALLDSLETAYLEAHDETPPANSLN